MKATIPIKKPFSAVKYKNQGASEKQLPSKKPVVVKCFICNQLYYSQQSFDIHMEQHQRRVTKNLPEQIHRKTLESFGTSKKTSNINRKNTTLQAINPNEISSLSEKKEALSKTQKIVTSNMKNKQEKTQKFEVLNLKQSLSTFSKKTNKISVEGKNISKKQTTLQQPNSPKKQYDKQLAEINKALEESNLLMSRISFLTQPQVKEEGSQIIKADQAISDEQDIEQVQEQLSEKTIKQLEFFKFVNENNPSIPKLEQELVKVNFHIQQLQNYQTQIQCLRKLRKFSTDEKNQQKINKIKSRIMIQVISYIQKQTKNLEKTINSQKKVNRESQAKKIENLQLNICAQCLGMISYGEQCIEVNYSRDGLKEYKHLECWEK